MADNPAQEAGGRMEMYLDAGEHRSVEFEERDSGAVEEGSTPDGTATPAGVEPATSRDPHPEASPRDPALLDRLQRLEMENRESRYLLDRLRTPEVAQPQGPTLDELETRLGRGEVIEARDLVAAFRRDQIQMAQQLRATGDLSGRRVMSEQKARGIFSPEAMGDGYDFDSMRARYVEPLYRENPAVAQLMHAVFPNDPAMGEMFVSVVVEALEESKGDPLKTFKAIRSAVSARGAASADVARSIRQSVERQVDRVERGSTRPTGPKTTLTADMVDQVNTVEEMDALLRRLRRGELAYQ